MCAAGEPSQLRALVVDDEAVVRKMMATLLSDAGFDCIEADSGEKALSVLKDAGDQLPAIGLLDLKMPGMDGVDLANAMQRDHPDVPIVAVTGSMKMYDIEDLLKAGFAAILTKPFKPERLQKLCQQLANRSSP